MRAMDSQAHHHHHHQQHLRMPIMECAPWTAKLIIIIMGCPSWDAPWTAKPIMEHTIDRDVHHGT
eukprot:1159054-Pelagomonas_calceolata.AAC.20